MKMLEAMRETINIAITKETDKSYAWNGSPLDETGPCSISHFEAMYSDASFNFPQDKLGRWLGFIQGVLCARGIQTLDELKELNKKFVE